jgi:uncharacterized protein with GYD domain
MATYIMLARFTQQGIQHIKESPNRLDAGKQKFQALGATLKEFYLVSGQYDMVVIFEAPDDATMAKVMLELGSKGNVQTETMRAFTENEYREIVGALP